MRQALLLVLQETAGPISNLTDVLESREHKRQASRMQVC